MSDLPYCPPIPGPWRAKPWYLISHNLEHKLLEQGSARQRRFARWMRGIEAAPPRRPTRISWPARKRTRCSFGPMTRTPQLRLPMVRCGVDPQLYVFSPGDAPADARATGAGR